MLMIISKCLKGYKLYGINSQIWGLESKGASTGMNALREAQRSRDHKEFSVVAKVVIRVAQEFNWGQKTNKL